MTERWQQVGQELGLELPSYIGRMLLPLFGGAGEARQTVVRSEKGAVTGRLVSRNGKNEAGLRDLQLVLASASFDGRVSIETHRPRELPESPFGPVTCSLVDFAQDHIRLQTAPRGRAGVSVPIEISSDGLEAGIQANALTDVAPLAKGEGIDIFHSNGVTLAHGIIQEHFAGHKFEPLVGIAMATYYNLRVPKI